MNRASLESTPVAPCEWELRVVAAARSGALAPGLAAHAVSCPECSEALMAIEFLAQADPVDVPAAGFVYWKSELRVRRENAQRALRPLRWIETGAVATLAALAIAAGVWLNILMITFATVGFGVAAAGCWWAVEASGRRRW